MFQLFPLIFFLYSQEVNKLTNKNLDVSHLNDKQKSIVDIFVKVAKEFTGEVSAELKTFWTPEEWKDKGEDYGTESELVVCYDGLNSFSHICDTMSGSISAHEKLQDELFKAGYFFEQCTNWYGAVYKS